MTINICEGKSKLQLISNFQTLVTQVEKRSKVSFQVYLSGNLAQIALAHGRILCASIVASLSDEASVSTNTPSNA